MLSTLALLLLATQEVKNDDLPTSLESICCTICDKVGPSVVAIQCEREKETPKSSSGMGALMDGGVFKNRPHDCTVSGVIVDKEGWIVTSHFNISGKVSKVVVILADGSEHDATVKGFNATYDIALLKIDAKNLPVLPKAELKPIKTGQFIAAVGRCPGGKNVSINQGIVSAPWRLSGRGIQVDARLNYGNAGGAVVDRNGKLIGITCKIDTKYAGAYGQNSGVGFAVTWDKLDEILPDLKAGKSVGEARRPFLGIQANVESEKEGVEIQAVTPASAAEKAGIKAGDVIVEFDGKKLKNFDDLRAAILGKQPGDKIKVTWLRGEEKMTAEVELGWAPGE